MQPFVSWRGNRKMSAATFSLPAAKSCPGKTSACVANCYARKAEKAYPTVLPSHKRNMAETRRPDFVPLMVDLITKKAPRFFRIHESGDFYSQAYLDKWCTICKSCPGTKFLAFTKSFHLNFSNRPENLTVIWSIWPDTDLDNVPAGPRAFAGDCGDTEAIECPGGCDACGMCWDIVKVGRNVHFHIH
jgi:hypothetical protein